MTAIAGAPELESRILALYDAGRYLDAFQLLDAGGGLLTLRGASGRALAGRLASNLGAERYGASIHLRAWRATSDANPLAYYIAMLVGRISGPVRSLELIERLQQQQLTDRAIADIASAKAFQLAAVRDYDEAERALAEGLAAQPNHPWLQVTKGYLASVQDRASDAIGAFREALEQTPNYRPAVQALADALVKQSEIDEARQLLSEAASELQSGAILLQSAQLEREMANYELARTHVEAALPLLPLRHKDRDARANFAGLAATLAYDLQEFDEAIRLAEESGKPFHLTVAENLRKNRDTGRRVVLDVGFTLQHDVTCVPATLSTLTRFWERPAEHLDIAESICYDGTPAHTERAWLESQGFFCREFTLTWDGAVALIDAGLPFTQTLIGYAGGHMQAVIGYDSRCGVLIFRDPSSRHSGEVLGKELIDQLRSTGPRGMVFVPQTERARVEAIDLADHQLWTGCYRVNCALEQHQPDAAVAAVEEMQRAAPDHRLTIHAKARVASYDGDLQALNALTDRLLDEFPNDQNQWTVKLQLLRQIGSRAERLAVLQDLCNRADCAIVYRHQLIEELLWDPEELDRVDYLLRRCMRSNPIDAQTYSLHARRAWIADEREQALKWSRYSASLDLRSEERSSTYFAAASALNRTDEALKMLQDRFVRFRERDCGPAISLVGALDQVFQQQQALETLESALSARPDDGDLQLFACNQLLRLGRLADARQQLTKAKGRCHEAGWLSMAARLARQDNRFDEALDFLHKALELTPLSLSTHRDIVETLIDSRGYEAAAAHINSAVERFPRNLDLRSLLIETLSFLGPERAEAAARAHLDFHPEHAWCWRELGFKLAEQRRWDEAEQAARQAERFQPATTQNSLLQGMVCLGRGDEPAAREFYEQAIRISVDYAPAIIELMQLCQTRVERQTALEFVLQQLKSQVIYGETLSLLRTYSARAFEPAQALAILTDARQARPDLWGAWSALIDQLLAMNRLEDARLEAVAAVERFPLLPGALIDLARVHEQLGDTDEEISQLRRALAIDSRSGDILRRLAEAYARTGDWKHEESMLRRACDTEPRNVTHRGALADFLWRQGDRDGAVEAIRQAIEQEPAYDWGWERLATWSFVTHQPDLLVDMARDVTSSRPKSPQAWLQRADLLSRFAEHADECLEAIQHALRLDPRFVDAHDHHATYLASHGQFDAAIQACEPTEFGGRVPMQLRSRAAIIESQRGNLESAIRSMRKMLDDDPDFAFGWSQLAGWLQHQGDLKGALEAARRLIDLAPRAAASWGYVADCLASQGENEQAKEHYRRSIQVDASYVYGGNALIPLQIEADEFDDALETLRTIGPHLTDHELAAREARLLALLDRRDEALDALGHASRCATDNDGWLLDAVDAMLLNGWVDAVKQILKRELEAGRAQPQAVGALVEVYAREATLSAIENLCQELDDSTPHWAEASVVYIDVLGVAQANDRLNAFVAAHARSLRTQSRCWGIVGSALERCHRYHDAIEWMSDWPSRADTEPHQLLPLVIALLKVGDTRQAKSAVDFALNLPLAAVTDALRVLGASAEAIDGDAAAVAARIELVAPQNLPQYYFDLYAIQRAASHSAAALEQGGSRRDAWATWHHVCQEHVRGDNDDFFEAMVASNRLLLVSRCGNPIRKWLAERKARRQLARLCERGVESS